MTNYFWVGGTGTWDGTTNHFAITSGGTAIAAAPGSSDTVTFDGNSGGGTVTVATNFNVVSVTMGAFTGTLDFSANNNNPTMQTFNCSGTGVRTLAMGTGNTWTITGNAATIFTIGTTTNLTLSPTTAIVNCTYSGSTGTRAFSSMAPLANNFAPRLKISAGSDIVSFAGNSSPGFQSIDFTGFSGVSNGPTGTWQIRDSLTLSSLMTFNATGTGGIAFYGTSTASSLGIITTNGITLPCAISFQGNGGSWQLGDNLICSSTITHTFGTLNANNKNVTSTTFTCSNANTRTLTMGSGTWTLTGTGTVWNLATTTGLTLTAGTSTIQINDASSSSKTFSGGGKTFNKLLLTGGGLGTMIIAGSNTFSSLEIDPPLTIQFTAGTTQTLSTPTFLSSGTEGQFITLQSTSNGSTWTLSSPNGNINIDYVSLQDSTATGGASFYAGIHSINVSNNSGWIFTDAPDNNQNATRDQNSVTGLMAVSSEDGVTPIRIYGDANTHALWVTFN